MRILAFETGVVGVHGVTTVPEPVAEATAKEALPPVAAPPATPRDPQAKALG